MPFLLWLLLLLLQLYLRISCDRLDSLSVCLCTPDFRSKTSKFQYFIWCAMPLYAMPCTRGKQSNLSISLPELHTYTDSSFWMLSTIYPFKYISHFGVCMFSTIANRDAVVWCQLACECKRRACASMFTRLHFVLPQFDVRLWFNVQYAFLIYISQFIHTFAECEDWRK